MLSAAAKLKDRKKADALILPFWQGKKEAEAACDSKELNSFISSPFLLEDFKGKEGETLFIYDSGLKERILLIGLGQEKNATLETLRKAYAQAVKAVLHKKCQNINVVIPDRFKKAYLPICEGILLTNYRYDHLKGESLKEEPPTLLSKVCFIGITNKELEECLKSQKIVDSVNFARDLINGNADDITAPVLVKTAKQLGKEFPSLKVTALDKARIEKEKMGLILAVNRSALHDPAVILIEYRGNPSSKELTAIVGKGMTYDTGGLNIKSSGMETMKADMSGAAAVFGALRAAAAIKLKSNLIGVIPAAENGIGPSAYKPGDVYKSMKGKTVEISNTDAEGRLILADALWFVQENYKPTQIVDLATLTGGIIIALGEEATGLFSNDDKLAQKLIQAGEKTHERIWRMPLYPEYKEMLKSPIADIQNSAGRFASAATAATFLSEFVKKEIPWAHLDIAGTAFLTKLKSYHLTHATGIGVRLLIQMLEDEHHSS
jgi:leucyl aminopeptidase